MRAIKIFTLTLLISIFSTQQSRAVVGVGSTFFNPGLGVSLALSGLGMSAYGFYKAEWDSSFIYPVLFFTGLVILDEKDKNIVFKKLDIDSLQNIERTDAIIYNLEVEEVNLIFDEISSSLAEDSTIEDASRMWDEMSDLISPETYKVLKSLISQSKSL